MPTDWTEEKLRYDGGYWGYNYGDGYNGVPSGYNQQILIFSEEAIVYGTVTEEP